MNHLSHASILLTNFKKKYLNEIEKSFNIIDDTIGKAYSRIESYKNIIDQC